MHALTNNDLIKAYVEFSFILPTEEENKLIILLFFYRQNVPEIYIWHRMKFLFFLILFVYEKRKGLSAEITIP